TAADTSLRRTVVVIILDALAASAVWVGAALWADPLRRLLTGQLGLQAPWDQLILSLGTVTLAALPAMSFLRATRLLGRQVAERVLGADDVQVGARLLGASVQLALLLGVGVPCAVLVLPFAGPRVIAVVAVVVAFLIVVIWRSASAYTLARHSAERLMDFVAEGSVDFTGRASEPADVLASTRAVTLEPNAYAVGKTLAELDLRAATGATAVALRSVRKAYQVPSGREVLRMGDVIAIAGTPPAIALARELLQHGAAASNLDDAS
ncbi:MAG TPA: TrkA C-terminal domain-containing protein, partial [Polyangiales bacterium]